LDTQTIFQAAPVGLFAAAVDGRLFHVNDQMTQVLSGSPKELEGKSLLDQLSGLDAETRWSSLATGYAEIKGTAFPFRRLDGAQIWARLSARSLRDDSGQLMILGSLEDVTEEVESVAAVRASESRLRQIHDASIIGIFTWRVDGMVTTANDAFLEIAGYSRDDLETGAIRWDRMTPPEYRAADEQALQEIASNGSCKPYNKEYFRKDGARTPLLIGAAAFHNDPDSGIAYVVDVTAKQQAEQEVHRLSEMQAAILNALPAHIAHVDQAGTIRSVNASWEKFNREQGANNAVGVNYLEACDRAWGPDAAGARGAADGIRAVLRGEIESFEMDYPCHTPSQSRWFRMLVTPMRLPGEEPGALVMHINDTERSRAEQAVAESNARYVRLVNDVNELFIKVDHDWNYTFINDKAAAIAGRTVDDFIGKNLWQVFPELVGSLFEREVRLAIETRTQRNFEIYSDSLSRWFEHRVYPSDDGLTILASDITAAKLTRLALQENEVRLRFALDSLDFGVWEWDIRSEKLYWSESFETLHGLAAASLERKLENYLGFVHTEDRSTVYRELTQAMKDRSRYEQEYRFIDSDGLVRWISNKASVVYDEAGVPVRMLGIVQDVTRRRQEADLIRGMAAIVKSSQDAIFTKTNDGFIDNWNQGAERIFGYTEAEAIGASVTLILPPDRVDEELGIHDRVRTGERIDQLETVRRRKDGVLIHVSLTLSPIYGLDGEVKRSSVIARDITERRKLEEQLRQSQKMEAIGQLAGGISHDFNNLLTIILGHCDLMQSRKTRDPNLAESLAEIREAAERAASLTRQLLAFSRRNVLQMKILDLNAIIEHSQKMCSRIIGEDITLSTKLAAGLDRIEADAGLLDQALLNLVVNARDAMPTGGRLSIETANVVLDDKYVRMHPDAQPGPAVLLSVKDSGCGIDLALLPRIFEPFFTTKGAGKGTGLGLATVYGIVKQCGGHVVVESELNRGSEFKIYLPAQPSAVVARQSEISDSQLRYGTEMVLIVEDEAGVRRYAREALISLGYNVLSAASGRDVERLLACFSGRVDLLLTDVVMPEMSGRDLADLLRTRFPQIKTLFMSGYTDDLIVRHGVSQAEVRLLQKPFSRTALAEAVRSAIDEQGS
jgi:PAS domain S-box-containing protein